MDEKTKKKISDAQLGSKNHMYGKKGILCPNFGRYPTKKTRLKMSISGKNKIFTEAHRKNLGLAHKGNKNYWYGTKGPMYNRSHNNRTKKVLSIKNTGDKNPRFGYICTEKERKRISKNSKLMWKNHKYREKMIKIFNTKKHKEKQRMGRLKQIFPKKDTKLEIMIQEELIKRNIPFKKHVPLIGQPDIFIEPNICVFADGDYWHANPIKYKHNDLISRQHNRIAEDIWKRDLEIIRKLTEMNYFVLRFWETDVYKDIKLIGDKIEKIVKGE